MYLFRPIIKQAVRTGSDSDRVLARKPVAIAPGSDKRRPCCIICHIMATITFYGGVGTVTGSKYLLEHNGRRVLVDCGLFQGQKELRERNWQDPAFDPAGIDVVIITHAHI